MSFNITCNMDFLRRLKPMTALLKEGQMIWAFRSEGLVISQMICNEECYLHAFFPRKDFPSYEYVLKEGTDKVVVSFAFPKLTSFMNKHGLEKDTEKAEIVSDRDGHGFFKFVGNGFAIARRLFLPFVHLQDWKDPIAGKTFGMYDISFALNADRVKYFLKQLSSMTEEHMDKYLSPHAIISSDLHVKVSSNSLRLNCATTEESDLDMTITNSMCLQVEVRSEKAPYLLHFRASYWLYFLRCFLPFELIQLYLSEEKTPWIRLPLANEGFMDFCMVPRVDVMEGIRDEERPSKKAKSN